MEESKITDFESNKHVYTLSDYHTSFRYVSLCFDIKILTYIVCINPAMVLVFDALLSSFMNSK